MVERSEFSKETSYTKIYPKIPTAPDQDFIEANSYRMNEILDIRKYFENEKEKRRKTHKKYSKAISVSFATEDVLFATSVGLGVSGVGLLATIVAAPIALGLEISALGVSVGSIILKFIGKKLQRKIERHLKILTLIEAKLNTIQDHISKAIEDGNITHEEYILISQEKTKYEEMVEEIRSQHKKIQNEKSDTETQEVVQQMKSFLDDLKKSKSKSK